MQFTKKDLKFLGAYNMCSFPSTFLGNKVKFQNYNDKILATQMSDNIVLIKDFEIQDREDANSYVYPIDKLFRLVNFSKEDDKIELTESGVKFGKKDKYEFSKIDIDHNVVCDLYDIIVKKNPEDTYTIKNIQLTKRLKTIIGSEDLNTIALMEGHFVASNLIDATGAVNTENKKDLIIYFPRVLISLFLELKTEEIELKKYKLDADKFNSEYIYCLKILDAYILFLNKEYKLVNIFDDKYAEIYNQDYKAIVSSLDFRKRLERIFVIASENTFSRIQIIFNKGELIIKSVDNGESIEHIEAEVDDEIINHEIYLSSNFLKTIIGLLEGEKFYFYIGLDDPPVVKIQDEKQEDKFYLQNLLEQ